MTALNIVPECYVDTKVAEIVGQIKKCNHQHGSGDVANELLRKLANNIALGIIDEDKHKGQKAKYLLEFKPIAENNGLILQKHPQRQHYIILVCPEIEKWLMGNAKAVNVNPVDYTLPTELKGLIKLTKIKNIDKNEGFLRFIKHLIKAEAPGITTLNTWLTLFNQRQLHTLHL